MDEEQRAYIDIPFGVYPIICERCEATFALLSIFELEDLNGEKVYQYNHLVRTRYCPYCGEKLV